VQDLSEAQWHEFQIPAKLVELPVRHRSQQPGYVLASLQADQSIGSL
jgi:hypothetical protein